MGKWQKENAEVTEDLEISTLTITQKGKEAKAAEEMQSFGFLEELGGPTKTNRKSDLRDLQIDDGELHYSCTYKGNKSEGVLVIRDGLLVASGYLEGTYSQDPEEFQAAVHEFTLATRRPSWMGYFCRGYGRSSDGNRGSCGNQRIAISDGRRASTNDPRTHLGNACPRSNAGNRYCR